MNTETIQLRQLILKSCENQIRRKFPFLVCESYSSKTLNIYYQIKGTVFLPISSPPSSFKTLLEICFGNDSITTHVPTSFTLVAGSVTDIRYEDPKMIDLIFEAIAEAIRLVDGSGNRVDRKNK